MDCGHFDLSPPPPSSSASVSWSDDGNSLLQKKKKPIHCFFFLSFPPSLVSSCYFSFSSCSSSAAAGAPVLSTLILFHRLHTQTQTMGCVTQTARRLQENGKLRFFFFSLSYGLPRRSGVRVCVRAGGRARS